MRGGGGGGGETSDEHKFTLSKRTDLINDKAKIYSTIKSLVNGQTVVVNGLAYLDRN